MGGKRKAAAAAVPETTKAADEKKQEIDAASEDVSLIGDNDAVAAPEAKQRRRRGESSKLEESKEEDSNRSGLQDGESTQVEEDKSAKKTTTRQLRSRMVGVVEESQVARKNAANAIEDVDVSVSGASGISRAKMSKKVPETATAAAAHSDANDEVDRDEKLNFNTTVFLPYVPLLTDDAKSQEIQKLRQECTIAVKELASANREVTALSQSNAALTNALDECKKRLAQSETNLQQREGDVKVKQDEIERLHVSIKDAKASAKEKENALAAAELKLKGKDEEIQGKKDGIESLHAKLADREKVIQEKDSELKVAALELHSKDGDIRTKKKQIEDLDSQLSAKDADVKKKDSELNVATLELAEARAKIDAKDVHIRALEDELAAFEQIEVLKTDLAFSKRQLTDAKGEIDAKQAQIDTLQKKLAALETTASVNANVKAELDNAKDQLVETMNEGHAKRAELIAILEAQVADLEQKETTTGADLKNAQEKATRMQEECKKKQVQIDSLGSRILRMQEDGAKTDKDLAATKDIVAGQESQIGVLESQLKELSHIQQKAEAELFKATEKLVDLEQDCKTKQERIEHLESLILRVKESGAKSDQDLNGANVGGLSAAENVVERHLAELDSLKEENAGLRRDVAKMQSQLKTAESTRTTQLEADLVRQNVQISSLNAKLIELSNAMQTLLKLAVSCCERAVEDQDVKHKYFSDAIKRQQKIVEVRLTNPRTDLNAQWLAGLEDENQEALQSLSRTANALESHLQDVQGYLAAAQNVIGSIRINFLCDKAVTETDLGPLESKLTQLDEKARLIADDQVQLRDTLLNVREALEAVGAGSADFASIDRSIATNGVPEPTAEVKVAGLADGQQDTSSTDERNKMKAVMKELKEKAALQKRASMETVEKVQNDRTVLHLQDPQKNPTAADSISAGQKLEKPFKRSAFMVTPYNSSDNLADDNKRDEDDGWVDAPSAEHPGADKGTPVCKSRASAGSKAMNETNRVGIGGALNMAVSAVRGDTSTAAIATRDGQISGHLDEAEHLITQSVGNHGTRRSLFAKVKRSQSSGQWQMELDDSAAAADTIAAAPDLRSFSEPLDLSPTGRRSAAKLAEGPPVLVPECEDLQRMSASLELLPMQSPFYRAPLMPRLRPIKPKPAAMDEDFVGSSAEKIEAASGANACVAPPRHGTRGRKPKGGDEKYLEFRRRNNAAVRKCKTRNQRIEERLAWAGAVEFENAVLRTRCAALEEEVAGLRNFAMLIHANEQRRQLLAFHQMRAIGAFAYQEQHKME